MTTESAPMPAHQASGTGRRLAMFRAPMSGPNQSSGIDTIVNRSRHLVRNNAWAGAAVEKYVSNAIGTGVQAKMVNGTPELKAAAGKLWRRWCKVSDADGQLEFAGQQALGVREYKEAGEVFARLRPRRRADGLPVPLQVQLIESEQCPRHYYATAPGGNVIREGIELDKIGRRVAYWMYRAHPGDQNTFTVNASELTRIPADQILHLYRPLRAGQLRGIPDLSSVLVLIFNQDRLSDNVMERQAVANLHTGFFTKPVNGEDGSVLGELPAQDDAADGTPVAGMEPGTMSELPAGWDVKFNDPPGAGADYAEFMRLNLLAFCARMGIPYEVLTGDLREISDRALKLLLLEFHRLIEMDLWLQIIPMFCGRVRDAWWDAAVLDGSLIAPDYATDPEEYRETLWVPQGWPYAHPVQDVDADIKAIRAGLTSRTKVVLGKGEDPEEIDAEQVADNERADLAGLTHDSDGRQAKNGPVATQPMTQDENA